MPILIFNDILTPTRPGRGRCDRRTMTKMIHPVAGAVAIVAIATFWLSTALTELFASHAIVILVKTAIP